MQTNFLNEILGEENREQDFTENFLDASDFDFWAAKSNSRFLSSENLPDDEKLSKFFKLHIFHNKTLKENSEELLTKCLRILKTLILSEQNQVLFLKLLSSLSTYHSSADIIKSTGLLKWVEEQSESDSPKLFLESWKILQNLKAHSLKSDVYPEGVYPFIPPWMPQQEPVADVILVHGIKGGAAWTWRQSDEEREKKPVLTQQQRRQLLTRHGVEQSYSNIVDETYSWIWPLDWLSLRMQRPFRIVAVDYPAHWWQWFQDGIHNTKDLSTLSEETLHKLKLSGVGLRPIIWIAHSMGGIIVKKMLLQEKACREKDASQSLLSSTHAVVFLSVPHFGSPLASWSCSLAPLLKPSLYLYHMKADCPNLLKIHKDFVEFCEQENVSVLTLNESQPCKVTSKGPTVTFVPSKYGNPEIGEFHEVNATHLDICKPRTRSDEKFRLIEKFLVKIFANLNR